jgi:hypothetical protein
MAATITREQITAALERCCNANPASGPGHKLHPDASRMADLFGVMLRHGRHAVELETVEPEIQEAINRWAAD